VAYEPSTHHLIDSSAFAAMRPGAWLVNTSRGGIVDEAAMLEALTSGRLAGAALDVLSGEPSVDAHHPVVQYAAKHDNCLVVPHIGGNTFESFEKTELFIAQRVLEAFV
jgi:D-3-phosphoglycerate dehydrogenase